MIWGNEPIITLRPRPVRPRYERDIAAVVRRYAWRTWAERYGVALALTVVAFVVILVGGH